MFQIHQHEVHIATLDSTSRQQLMKYCSGGLTSIWGVSLDESFVLAFTEVQNKSTRAQTFRDLVKVLPPANKETMKTLFSHLLR